MSEEDTVIVHPYWSEQPGSWTRVNAVYRCDNCKRLVLAYGEANLALQPYQVNEWIDDTRSTGVRWLPAAGVPRAFADVPSHLASAASEAYECNSIGAYRAAIALTRSVLEATAKDKGFLAGQLFQKIDSMYAAGHLRAHIKDAAHEIRHLGNDMAHGDFVESVSAEEADLALTLMGEVLAEVYQSPARVARAQQAREKKRENARAQATDTAAVSTS